MAFRLIITDETHGTIERSVTLEELEDFHLQLDVTLDGENEPAVLDLGEGFRIAIMEED